MDRREEGSCLISYVIYVIVHACWLSVLLHTTVVACVLDVENARACITGSASRNMHVQRALMMDVRTCLDSDDVLSVYLTKQE